MISPTILFLAGKEPDYQSALLYRGFVDLLGPERVIDVGCSYYLHDYMAVPAGHGRNLTCEEIGRCAGLCGSGYGDAQEVVFVLNNSHLRDTDGSWDAVLAIHDSVLVPASMVYVVGGDHTGPYRIPPVLIDSVFQREIDPDNTGSLRRQPLLFSCLESWIITEPQDRPIDVFYAGSPTDPGRAAIPRLMAELSEAGLSVVCGSGKGISRSSYMELLRRSKMAVCPVGAGASDTLRNWEAIASGALPIFPSHPKRSRGDIDNEPVLDFNGITWDNFTIRAQRLRDSEFGLRAVETEQKLIAIARKNTTTERARRVLKSVGFDY